MQHLCSKDCFSILDHAITLSLTTLQLYQRSHSYSMGKTYTKSSTLSLHACLFKTFLAIFCIVMFPFVLYIKLAFCAHYTFNSVLTQCADDRRQVFFKKERCVVSQNIKFDTLFMTWSFSQYPVSDLLCNKLPVQPVVNWHSERLLFTVSSIGDEKAVSSEKKKTYPIHH